MHKKCLIKILQVSLGRATHVVTWVVTGDAVGHLLPACVGLQLTQAWVVSPPRHPKQHVPLLVIATVSPNKVGKLLHKVTRDS